MRASTLGALAAALTLGLDQASKLYLLRVENLPASPPMELGPFLTLVAVWNRGISYGLFQQGTDLGRYALIGISVAACIVIGVWLSRTTSRLLALSLGLIAGGAAGNTVDRALYPEHAVFDFVHFHVGSFSWYVFNLADAAIVFGVAGLVVDALLAGRAKTEPDARAVVTGKPD